MATTLLIGGAVILALAALGAAWGPGTHLELADRVLRRKRELLPERVARVLTEHRDAYLYGNLAADIINMKNFGGHRNHCHRWTIVDDFRATDPDDPVVEAFALGYLSHLAADTIAHNHFVPYHLVRFARTKGLGHLYWEMNADRFVPEKQWHRVRHMKANRELDHLDELINTAVPKKALSMRANKLLFNHVLLISERETWRRGVSRLHPLEKVSLDRRFLDRFRKAAAGRIRLALSRGGRKKLEHLDTTGKKAQQQAMKLRREIVRKHPPGDKRHAAGEAAARPFLEGMQSPPAKNGAAAHW